MRQPTVYGGEPECRTMRKATKVRNLCRASTADDGRDDSPSGERTATRSTASLRCDEAVAAAAAVVVVVVPSATQRRSIRRVARIARRWRGDRVARHALCTLRRSSTVLPLRRRSARSAAAAVCRCVMSPATGVLLRRAAAAATHLSRRQYCPSPSPLPLSVVLPPHRLVAVDGDDVASDAAIYLRNRYGQ
ncbi:hypothetical protein KIN20_035940 [Parelaphostrongylus tenuis]|uniref:Uncharacterized protein n=1 Tax=Parelaphostrongylus tenuis TaxID=148309 RepID=A0AAD5RBX2_PARTN|nr:hypothetical protein KIN20_035940 [Parelaphostrongylus tenuis]